ncbi:MAG: hypothetical protein AAB967_02220 [Patescibacteria group bacterium]
MIEFERTFLAKEVPAGLGRCECKEVLDIYIPAAVEHPTLRIRKNGEKYEMTKKSPIEDGDFSRQKEHTIPLVAAEFEELSFLKGKRVRKMRYYLPYEGRVAEVDVFQDALSGLVLIDFEFASEEEKDAFVMPDFCLADVTQEKFLAGGTLAGKSYADIEDGLKRFGYSPLFFTEA